MYAIAIARVGEDADAEGIARVLGVSAYDVRLMLSGVLPRVATTVASAEEANGITRSLAALAVAVIACDTSPITPTERIVHAPRFHSEPQHSVAANAPATLANDTPRHAPHT